MCGAWQQHGAQATEMAVALLARAQPDNWKVSGIDFVTSWIQAHIAAAATLGKPLIIEEVRP